RAPAAAFALLAREARLGREIDVKFTSVGPCAELRQSGERSTEGSNGVELGGRRLLIVRACAAAALTVLVMSPARAVEAISVRTDAQAIDLTDAVERHRGDTDRLRV